jgi:O-antigen ligase
MINRPFLQNFVSLTDRRLLPFMIGTAAAILASIIGLSLALVGPIYTVALLIALAGAVWVIWCLENALWAILAIIALLPFGSLPFKVVITPTFLDLALGAALFLYLSQWMFRERRQVVATPVHIFLILFILLAIFSFIAGLRYSGLAINVLRKFAEFVLSMGFVLVLVDILRTPDQLRKMTVVILLTGALAAMLGIVLWAMPDSLAERVLARLAIVGYPDAGVIQYIEQNPELGERAIGTSVNPNSLGGFLVMVAALATPQLLSRYPVTGKRYVIPILLLLVGCLVLTFSRGSMLAFVAALLFIAALRYRRALAILIVIALVLFILPWSQAYLARFVSGFQGEDLATQMRFGEYTDALTLVSRYPLFGVGFTGAPDIDIYLGVSSVYLLIAENMGLLGLVVFLILMIGVIIYGLSARHAVERIPGLAPIWLGLLAALISALVNGIGDHYFFNLEFQHAVLIFWTFIGLTLAVSRIALVHSKENAGVAPTGENAISN